MYLYCVFWSLIFSCNFDILHVSILPKGDENLYMCFLSVSHIHMWNRSLELLDVFWNLLFYGKSAPAGQPGSRRPTTAAKTCPAAAFSLSCCCCCCCCCSASQLESELGGGIKRKGRDCPCLRHIYRRLGWSGGEYLLLLIKELGWKTRRPHQSKMPKLQKMDLLYSDVMNPV